MATKEDTRKREKALQRHAAEDRLSPWDDMERWFGEFGRRGWLQPFNWEWPQHREGFATFSGKLPKVDLLDRRDKVVVRAELPGVSKEDVDVTVDEHSVTIKAASKHEEKEEEGEYYRREMSSGEYQRTLALPATVDEAKATATFKNGVLELTLPKREKTNRKTLKVE
jgi:HSP20 family protein